MPTPPKNQSTEAIRHAKDEPAILRVGIWHLMP